MTARLFKALLYAALLFALVMAGLPQAPSLPGSPSDKLLHIGAFGVLAVFAAAAYPAARLVTVFVCLVCFGGLIEVLQMLPGTQRTASWLDLLADAIAVGSTLFLIHLVRSMRKNRSDA